jgi:O-antigen ligase
MTAVPLRAQYQPVPAPMANPIFSTDAPGGIGGFQQIGYKVLILFLFLIFSRVFDVKFSFLHIPGIAQRIIFATVLLGRAFIPALKGGIGRAMGFYAIWFVCCIPTSCWRGGSYGLFQGTFIAVVMIYLATAGLITNFAQARRATYTVGFALFVLTLIAVVYGSTEDTGRLFLPNGKYSNPNEMAQALLEGMPLIWLMFLDTKSPVKKLMAFGAMFLMLIMVSKTGSRGALIAFTGLVFVAFMRSSIMGKLKMVVAGAVLMAIIVGLMPGRLLRRYTTLTEDSDAPTGIVSPDDYDAGLQASAVSSTYARRELLRKSIKYTLQHPIFGVGPGMFVVAEDIEARQQGRRTGMWQGTHNSYTQVSSELGFPGAIAYVAVIVLSLKKTSGLYKRTKDDPRLKRIANCALCLNYCMVVYAISVFFDYIAYTSMLSVFAGLAAVVTATAPAEIDRLTSETAEPEPIPFEQFQPRWRTTAGVAPQM